jgi:hypothetical protein
MMNIDLEALARRGVQMVSAEDNSVYEETPMSLILVREQIIFSFKVHRALIRNPIIWEFVSRNCIALTQYVSLREQMTVDIKMTERQFQMFQEFLELENIDSKDQIWMEEYREGDEYNSKPM